MSQQLSFSALFCVVAMALFALTATATVPADANGATAGAIAPLASLEIAR